MTTDAPILYWFRQDLRLTDHPVLDILRDNPAQKIIPLYILDDTGEETRALGGASRFWLHHSLSSLNASLGNTLILRKSNGSTLGTLRALIKETGACAMHWSRLYDAQSIRRDAHIKTTLTQEGIPTHSHNASLLFEPWTITTKTGKNPFRVFTPFWKACLASDTTPPKPQRWEYNAKTVFTRGKARSESLDAWHLLPTNPDWTRGMRAQWGETGMGEEAAQTRLGRFIETHLNGYSRARDIPACAGTSFLAPHLHFGELSLRQIWHAVKGAEAIGLAPTDDCTLFLTEIGWREFGHHLLYHNPTLPTAPLDPRFAKMPWIDNANDLAAWQRGQTGFPIVDAGMRELWQTGWMHNRVRMIVGSFLVKDLLIPWQKGEEWFWDTLLDADAASNAMNWQWIAGCGADAAPWFRIFNPTLQGEKFDPDGSYIRRFVPELAKLPAKWIHRPWQTPEPELRSAGITLGTTYPHPMIDHAFARKRALDALKATSREETTC